MFKKTISVASIMGLVMCQGMLLAEEPSMADTNPSGGESVAVTFTENVQTQMEQIVRAAKLKKAKKKGLAAYATVSASVAMKPTDPKYAQARQLAYERAFLEAKTEIAKLMESQISSQAALALTSGKNDSGSATSDKVADMINDQVKKSLIAKGIDLTDEAAVKAALPEITSSTEFKKSTQIAAAAYMIGVQTFRTVSDGNSIGVVAVYSEKTRQIAEAMFTGAPLPQGTAGQNIEDMLDSLDPQTVANTFGIRPFVDEDGAISLIAFTQEAITSNSGSALNIARAKTSAQAASMYREFAGQEATLAESLEKSQSISELSDNLGELSSIDENYSKKCAAKGEAMSISGIELEKTWTVVLPSGHKVLCVAYSWSPQAAAFARQAKANSEASKNAVKRGVPQQKSAPKKSASEKTEYKNVKTSGDGFDGGFF